MFVISCVIVSDLFLLSLRNRVSELMSSSLLSGNWPKTEYISESCAHYPASELHTCLEIDPAKLSGNRRKQPPSVTGSLVRGSSGEKKKEIMKEK